MGRKRHSAKEIVNKLRQAIVELAKGHSVWGVSSDDVLERLAWLMVTRGVHAHIRRDNGSEFTAGVVREWLGKIGVRTLYIEPGSPWKKGDVESFNRKLRAELLTGEIFYTSNQCGGVDRGTLLTAHLFASAEVPSTGRRTALVADFSQGHWGSEFFCTADG